MAEYQYDITDFLNDKVELNKLTQEVNESVISDSTTVVLNGITAESTIVIFEFSTDLTTNQQTSLDSVVSTHDGEPLPPTPVEEFVDARAIVTDPYTNISGEFVTMQTLVNRRELFNDTENPLYTSELTPILGDDGYLEDHADRILNLEEIHDKHSWHLLSIKRASYQRPKDILFYYGWPNSFNSATNGWNNENVAKDMAKYSVVVLGDGVQDPSHGDFSNTQIIIPRIKELNPETRIFGYVTTDQSLSNFKTKAEQWDSLDIHGIFMDESGYDFGRTRSEFNERVDYVHNDMTSANVVFANAWNMDHILGTLNDENYPNSTYNSSLLESNLTYTDWVLLESFPVSTSYGDGYESGSEWKQRYDNALYKRAEYDIRLAAVCTITNDSTSAIDQFNFAYISSLMLACEGFGTSDEFYGASSARVDYYERPDLNGVGRIFSLYPTCSQDGSDSDVYYRYIDSAKFTLDFSPGAQTSSITKLVSITSGGSGTSGTSGTSGQAGTSGTSGSSGTSGTSPAGGGSVNFFQMRKTNGGTIFNGGTNTVVWNVEDYNDDSNISHVDGVFQIGSALDGKMMEFNINITGTGANNRAQMTVLLEKYNGVSYDTIAKAVNYTARNTTQTDGGICINGFLDEVATGDYYRIQAGIIGAAMTFDTLGCWVSMKAF